MQDRARVLALLHELQEADAKKGAVLGELDRLTVAVREIHVTASDLQDFEARLPVGRERLASELARARAEEAAARDALSRAEEALRTVNGAGEADAQRFEIRARDRLSIAERRRAEAESTVEELDRQAQTAQEELRSLRSRASAVAGELRGRPRLAEGAGAHPGSDLEDILNWGETARAALFVARAQVAAERDAVIRQANELGAAALGEPLTSGGAGLVARRVERALE